MLEGLGGLRVVQHLLERRVDALRLPDLLDRAAVVAGVRRRRRLGVEDERAQRGDVRQPVVPLHVAEDHVEERQRRPRGEEVVHVGLPRAVEARDERQLRVVVEQHEPGLVDRLDRHAVVAVAVAGGVLQRNERCPQRRRLPGLDPEEQAELAGRTDAPARLRPRTSDAATGCLHASIEDWKPPATRR